MVKTTYFVRASFKPLITDLVKFTKILLTTKNIHTFSHNVAWRKEILSATLFISVFVVGISVYELGIYKNNLRVREILTASFQIIFSSFARILVRGLGIVGKVFIEFRSNMKNSRVIISLTWFTHKIDKLWWSTYCCVAGCIFISLTIRRAVVVWAEERWFIKLFIGWCHVGHW